MSEEDESAMIHDVVSKNRKEKVGKKKSKKKSKKRKRRHDYSSDSGSDSNHEKKSSRPTEIDEDAQPSISHVVKDTAQQADDRVSENTKSEKSKTDFFAELLARENSKPPVGTFHAVGKKTTEASLGEASRDWTCHKCLTSNYRHSHQCQKCKAMKRMSEWR